jgi:single-stranded-DNA-specific exonuclease
MGEGRHLRFTVEAGGHRARAVAFGTTALPDEEAVDALFGLELNEWGGAVEPRLVLRCAQPPEPASVTLAGEPEDAVSAALAELDAPLPVAAATPPGRPGRDRRRGGAAGVVAALVATGEPVLVVCADARARRRHLAGRLGGFALASWTALERDPALAAPDAHVVALDPPAAAGQAALVDARFTFVWGEAETAFALVALEAGCALRTPAAAVFRGVRDAGLAGAVAAVPAPATAGRALRVLAELGLVAVDAGAGTARVASTARTELERSEAFRAWAARGAEGRARLERRRAAVAA